MKSIVFVLLAFFSIQVLATDRSFNNANGNWGDAASWTPSGVPGVGDNITIPNGKICNFGSFEGNRFCNNFTIDNGGTFIWATTDVTSFLAIRGNVLCNGTFILTGNVYCELGGGTAGTPATIGGTGNLLGAPFNLGKNRTGYYKMNNDLANVAIFLNLNFDCSFDMNGYNLSTRLFTLYSGRVFKQGSGTLLIEGSTPAIDDGSFQEQTGTTYFGSGTNFAAANQTIPSISYYNLKARTNSGFTVTLGSGSTFTVAHNFDVVAGTNGGSVSMANNNVNVTGTLSVASGSTFNLNGTNSKTLQVSTSPFTNNGTISGFNGASPTSRQLVCPNDMQINGSGTWTVGAFFYENLNINGGTITINDGYFKVGNTNGNYVTNTGIINGSTTYYHLYIDKDYTISGTGKYAGICVGNEGKCTGTLGSALQLTGTLEIHDNEPDVFETAVYDLKIGGSFINNGTFNANSNTVTFNGNAAATIQGTATTTFYNLVTDMSGNAVTLTNTSTAFQVNNNLTVTKGVLTLGATNADYSVSKDVSVSSDGTLKHSVLWPTSTRKLLVGKDFLIDGSYDYSAVTSALVQLNGAAGATINYISVPNSALSFLRLTSGKFLTSGNLTINNNFHTGYNSAAEFHTNSNTVTANNGLFIDGGTVYADGGLIDVTAGGINVGSTNLAGILNISAGTARCNAFNNGDGTRAGTTSLSGGTLDINGIITLNNPSTFTCSNAPTIYLAGDWVNKGGVFNVGSTPIYFDGAIEQKININAVGNGYTNNFTFYDVFVTNTHASGVKFYYSTSSSTLINFNNIQINSGSKGSIYGN